MGGSTWNIASSIRGWILSCRISLCLWEAFEPQHRHWTGHEDEPSTDDPRKLGRENELEKGGASELEWFLLVTPELCHSLWCTLIPVLMGTVDRDMWVWWSLVRQRLIKLSCVRLCTWKWMGGTTGRGERKEEEGDAIWLTNRRGNEDKKLGKMELVSSFKKKKM